ncbi:MAG TPA: DUF1998 domain-containing protein [Verrucomicrobiae bacterium]|nr:DUF1998 domain-containing protein [Verrucomicrobiae bacterium]
MNRPQIRASQLVTTFGPGAMVDLPEGSIIVGGLDHWHYEAGRFFAIDEPRLLAKLRHILDKPTLTLRAPPPANENPQEFHPDVTGWTFPEWFIVQNTVTTGRGFRRRRLVQLVALEGKRYQDVDKKKHPVVPVRFVRACKRGHVGDIDWQAFVHGAGDPCPRDLWIEERGTSGDLDEVWIVCDCGKDRAMSQAARLELKALGHCNGSRPWLGAGTRESCGELNRLLIRSASNAYFPQLMSVISIPDPKTPVDDVVRAAWEAGLSIVDSPEKLVLVRQIPAVAVRIQGLDDDVLMASIERVRSGSGFLDKPVKEAEFEALSDAKEELGSDVPEGAFFARTLPQEKWQAAWMANVGRVVLVHRLREVVAQLGFTRFEAIGPDIQGELELDVQPAALATDATWLPAVENRGEGVFLKFRTDAIRAWLKRPEVIARGKTLLGGFERWKAEHEDSRREFPGLPYYMLHSFSHLLLTAMALECGYPASSLRERVYAAEGTYGILIYTGSSDAEGTLGGLIQATRDIRRHVRRALEMGLLCSNDPVCAHHAPAKHDHQQLLGSACHGCLLVSETSCEQRNEFLDRALVVPTVEALGAGFFDAVS